jgi:crotonobetainyl-CoA:carnitine CoA-transferase CaiB-like acyl-CoA transferase
VPDEPRYPLAGLKVLDFTQYVAGPYCTQILADLGAIVLKVERPGKGDVYRDQGPVFVGGESVSFLALNRGKRSIALDLRDADDQATALALAGEADVLVENMRPGTLAKYGLGYVALSERHPALVYCSISGFGQDGPLAGDGAYDLTIQAVSGLISLTGHPGQAPAKVPVAALDFGSAMYGVIGILAALRERDRSGRGEWVQTSLLETSLAWLSMHVGTLLAGGPEPQPMGTRSPFFAPYEAYRTADGFVVVVGTGGDRGWQRFCAALGIEELLEDPRFHDNSSRVRNADALREEAERALRRRPTAHWVRVLDEAGVPNAPVQTLPQVLASEQVRHLRAVVEREHPTAGPVALVRLPLTFDRAGSTAPGLSPALDEHAAVGFGEA